MPELPEVETLKLGLQKYIVGKRIFDVEIRDSKVFEGSAQDVIGATVSGVRRLAKGILIDLNNNYSIAVHIKLTGQLIYRDSTNKDLPVQKPTPQPVPNKFTRVIFKLNNSGNPSTGSGLKKKNVDSFLFFQEVRGFAWMKILKTDNVLNLPFFKSLGPEPFVGQASSGQAKLTPEKFSQIINGSNLPIKVLLMDQKKIGGIGNIYANDACWDAQIDPRKRSHALSSDERKTLYESMLKVLKNGLAYRGSSELNFVDVLGQQGEYQKHVLVYGRQKKACRREDGGMVEKIYLGGRGTYFCPICQH